MLDLLLIGLFAGHLLLVDVAMAGPLVCVWLDWRGTRYGDEAAAAVGKRLAGWVVIAFTGGVVFGLAMWGLLRWVVEGQERYLRVFEHIPTSRVIGMVSELLFFFVVMVVYVATWERWRKWRWLHRLLAIVAGTTLLSHFPPLFSMLSAMSSRVELAGEVLDRNMYHALFTDPEVLARTTHHILASLAVVGVIVGCQAARRITTPAGQPLSAAEQKAACVGMAGARLALGATLLQLPVGTWVFMQFPPLARDQMLGSDGLGTGLFITGLVCVMGLLHHLAPLALGDLNRRKVYVAGLLLIATTVLMTGMLHRSRTNLYRQLDLSKDPAAKS